VFETPVATPLLVVNRPGSTPCRTTGKNAVAVAGVAFLAVPGHHPEPFEGETSLHLQKKHRPSGDRDRARSRGKELALLRGFARNREGRMMFRLQAKHRPASVWCSVFGPHRPGTTDVIVVGAGIGRLVAGPTTRCPPTYCPHDRQTDRWRPRGGRNPDRSGKPGVFMEHGGNLPHPTATTRTLKRRCAWKLYELGGRADEVQSATHEGGFLLWLFGTMCGWDLRGLRLAAHTAPSFASGPRLDPPAWLPRADSTLLGLSLPTLPLTTMVPAPLGRRGGRPPAANIACANAVTVHPTNTGLSHITLLVIKP